MFLVSGISQLELAYLREPRRGLKSTLAHISGKKSWSSSTRQWLDNIHTATVQENPPICPEKFAVCAALSAIALWRQQQLNIPDKILVGERYCSLPGRHSPAARVQP